MVSYLKVLKTKLTIFGCTKNNKITRVDIAFAFNTDVSGFLHNMMPHIEYEITNKRKGNIAKSNSLK